MIRWWSNLDEDARWTLYVTAPAFALSLPVYCVSTVHYLLCRSGFGDFLDYAASCDGLRRRDAEQPAA